MGAIRNIVRKYLVPPLVLSAIWSAIYWPCTIAFLLFTEHTTETTRKIGCVHCGEMFLLSETLFFVGLFILSAPISVISYFILVVTIGRGILSSVLSCGISSMSASYILSVFYRIRNQEPLTLSWTFSFYKEQIVLALLSGVMTGAIVHSLERKRRSE